MIIPKIKTIETIARLQMGGRITDGNELLADYHAVMLAHTAFLQFPLLRPCRYCGEYCENECVITGWIPEL